MTNYFEHAKNDAPSNVSAGHYQRLFLVRVKKLFYHNGQQTDAMLANNAKL